MRRPGWIPALLPLLLLPLLRPFAGGARAEEPGPLDCPIKALLVGDDAGLRRVYDGIRRGLEQAELPRVCLEPLAAGEEGEATLARLEQTPPPLLFVLGTAAARRLGERLSAVPRVYVDVAWRVGGRLHPAEATPRGPAALVHGVLPAARLGEVLRDLLGHGPDAAPPPVVALWPQPTDPEALARWRQTNADLEREARVRLVPYRPEAPADAPRAVLDLALETSPASLAATGRGAPDEEAAGIARALRAPLLSDRLENWRAGAAVLLLPDHHLLGRVAADLGRQLLTAPLDTLLRREVLTTEVRLDLEAARAVGFEPPLSFVAGADVLRRGARSGGAGR
jgi:hypothetical protein